MRLSALFCTGFSHIGLNSQILFSSSYTHCKNIDSSFKLNPVLSDEPNEPDRALLQILIGKMAASAGKSIISHELLLSLEEERLNGATHSTPVVTENQQHMATCLDSSITRTGV